MGKIAAPTPPPVTTEAAPPLPVLQGRRRDAGGYREGGTGEAARMLATAGVGLLVAVCFLAWPLIAFHAPQAWIDAVAFGGVALVLCVEAGAFVTALFGWGQSGSRFALAASSLFLLAAGSVVVMTYLIRTGIWW